MDKTIRRLIFVACIFAFIFLSYSWVAIFHAYSFTHPVENPGRFNPKSMNLTQKQALAVLFTGIRPERRFGYSFPSDFMLDYENVSFESNDGIKLKGWFIKSNGSKGTIILTHGWGSGKEALLNYSAMLSRNGYSSLLFDFRGSGGSEGNYTSLGYKERHDIIGALNYLRTREDVDADKLGAIGFSMGSAAIVMASKESNGKDLFAAIVLDSLFPSIHQNVARRFKAVYGLPKFPFATSLVFFGGMIGSFNAFDLAPINYINSINSPILIIQGTEDQQVFVEDAYELFEKANDPKEVWIVKGANHAESFKKEPSQYEKKIIDFFNSNMNKSLPSLT